MVASYKHCRADCYSISCQQSAQASKEDADSWLCCLSAGFDVQVVVLNTSVIGRLANSSLPSIEVVPPSSGFNVTWSALLMTVDVDAPGLRPFVADKQRLLTGLVIQAGSSPVKLVLFAAHFNFLSVLIAPWDMCLLECLIQVFSYSFCCGSSTKWFAYATSAYYLSSVVPVLRKLYLTQVLGWLHEQQMLRLTGCWQGDTVNSSLQHL